MRSDVVSDICVSKDQSPSVSSITRVSRGVVWATTGPYKVLMPNLSRGVNLEQKIVFIATDSERS